MSTFRRYWLLQIPGGLIAALVVLILHLQFGLPGRWAVAALAAVLLKDLLLYPITRRAYEGDGLGGADRLEGRDAVAVGDLDPEGYVQVGAERWKARCEPAEGRIEAGTRLRVLGARGLTLLVERRS